jgi:hypothetical protein
MGMGSVFLYDNDLPAPPEGLDVCGRVTADLKKVKFNQGYYARAGDSGHRSQLL